MTDKECVEYARECTRLADLIGQGDIRDELLKLACHWMEAAAHERLACAVDPLARPRKRPGNRGTAVKASELDFTQATT
jgi:hypothetical protein